MLQTRGECEREEELRICYVNQEIVRRVLAPWLPMQPTNYWVVNTVGINANVSVLRQ